MMTGVQMQHVPYRGSAPMLTDLLAGHVQVAFDNLPASIEHIRAGKLQALAITTADRSEMLPDVPALAEFLPGYETSSWLAIGAPSRTPAGNCRHAQQEDQRRSRGSQSQSPAHRFGRNSAGGSLADAAALIAGETEKWRKAVRFSGAKAN